MEALKRVRKIFCHLSLFPASQALARVCTEAPGLAPSFPSQLDPHAAGEEAGKGELPRGCEGTVEGAMESGVCTEETDGAAVTG